MNEKKLCVLFVLVLTFILVLHTVYGGCGCPYCDGTCGGQKPSMPYTCDGSKCRCAGGDCCCAACGCHGPDGPPPDPCKDVNCDDKCVGDVRYFGGTCDNGNCIYQSETCDYGCQNNACLDPDNDQTLCEQHGFIWMENECCGDDPTDPGRVVYVSGDSTDLLCLPGPKIVKSKDVELAVIRASSMDALSSGPSWFICDYDKNSDCNHDFDQYYNCQDGFRVDDTCRYSDGQFVCGGPKPSEQQFRKNSWQGTPDLIIGGGRENHKNDGKWWKFEIGGEHWLVSWSNEKIGSQNEPLEVKITGLDPNKKYKVEYEIYNQNPGKNLMIKRTDQSTYQKYDIRYDFYKPPINLGEVDGVDNIGVHVYLNGGSGDYDSNLRDLIVTDVTAQLPDPGGIQAPIVSFNHDYLCYSGDKPETFVECCGRSVTDCNGYEGEFWDLDVTVSIPNLGIVEFNGNTDNNLVLASTIHTYDLWYSPSVLLEDGTYHMWFSDNSDVMYTTSDDGINWETPQKLDGFSYTQGWNSGGSVACTRVTYDDGVYRMWWVAEEESNYKLHLAHATSDDGINWDHRSSPVISDIAQGTGPAVDMLCPSIIHDGTEYHIWYNSDDNTIVHKTSSDGIDWDDGSSSAAEGEVNTVILHDGRYELWFYKDRSIYYTTSADGEKWRWDNAKLGIQPPEPIKSWYDPAAFGAYVIKEGDNYQIWYTIAPDEGDAWQGTRIAYATGEDTYTLRGNPPKWDYVLVGQIVTVDGVEYMCASDGKFYNASDIENNPQLCEDLGYIWVDVMCCGNDEGEIYTNSPLAEEYGCCFMSDQCLVSNSGTVLNDNEPETYFTDDKGPHCIATDQYILDNKCENNIWTTRTKDIALNLHNIFENIPKSSYVLYCDNYSNVLTYYEYISPTAEPIEDTYLTGTSCGGDGKEWPCLNNFCVISTQDGSFRILGGSINYLMGVDKITDLLSHEADCNGAIENNDGNYNPCSGSNLWINAKTQSFIFSKDSTINIPAPDAGLFEKFLRSPFSTLLSFIRGVFTPTEHYEFTENFIGSSDRYDKIYVYNDPDKSVRARYEAIYVNTTLKEILAINYTGFDSSGICSSVNTNYPGMCVASGDSAYVGAVGNYGEYQGIWQDMTSSLRIEPGPIEPSPEPECTDSDGGYNYYTYGEVKDKSGTIYKDACIPDLSGLTEFACKGDGYYTSQFHSCVNEGKICQVGACIPAAGNSWCTDNDGGYDFAESSTVVYSVDGTEYTEADRCVDQDGLTEVACDNKQWTTQYHSCRADGKVCQLGACIEETVGQEYQIPVLVISYIPVTGDGKVDTSITGDVRTDDVETLRNHISAVTTQAVEALEKGSTYHGYKDSGAVPSLDYSVYEELEFLEALPQGLKVPWGTAYRPDYMSILEDIGICDYVDNHNVKEVWLWGYHTADIEPVESDMSMGTNIQSYWNYGTYGDVSNSERTDDLPICQKTYALFNYNYGRQLGEALEDHTHHIEAVLRHIDSDMWNNLFVGPCGTQAFYRCGWTHYPPNVREYCSGHDYDWFNTREVLSDCEDWKPDGSGQKKTVSCRTWNDYYHSEDYCVDDGGTAFKVWWMENIPGMNNNLEYEGKELKDWWIFIGDFDSAIESKSLVYE